MDPFLKIHRQPKLTLDVIGNLNSSITLTKLYSNFKAFSKEEISMAR